MTFDDGPNPETTPALLETLAEHGVNATFFLVGSLAFRHESLVEQIAAGGHTIGNHSLNHRFMPLLTTAVLEQEIDRTNDQLTSITGRKVEYFRPPYGIIDSRAADCLTERAMTPVYWGPVPLDWEAPGSRRVVKRVMRRLSNGSLVVLHEIGLIGKQTISAAKEIICKGRELGFEFVGIQELMDTELAKASGRAPS